MKRILITGASGFIGSALVEALHSIYSVASPTRAELDLLQPTNVDEYMDRHRPDMVIHTAAYTDLEGAERERGNTLAPCWQTNVEGTTRLVKASVNHGAHCIVFSSDYVFGGLRDDPGPYKETHDVFLEDKHMSWYGYTKARAERLLDAIPLAHKAVTILRINNVVSSSHSYTNDYLGQMIRLYAQDKLYPLFVDQQIGLTDLDDVIFFAKRLCNNPIPGVYHISSADYTTPWNIMKHVLSKRVIPYRKPIRSMQMSLYRTASQWPRMYHQYMGLDAEESSRRCAIRLYPWRTIVDRYLSAICTKKNYA